MRAREFSVADAYPYDHRSPWRWVASHIRRYPWLPLLFLLTTAAMAGAQSLAAVLVGRAFDTVVGGAQLSQIALAALAVAAAYLAYSASDIINTVVVRLLAQRVERDARDEVYLSLLGKSQTFHGRQRVGEVMARVTNDVQQTTQLVSPGFNFVIESLLSLLVPLITIALLQPELLLVPVIFLIVLAAALWRYNARLRPVAGELRERFGVLNAGLTEAVAGIEVVKGFAQEQAEAQRFSRNARAYRDAFVRQGRVEARSLPLLVYGVAIGLAFGHALLLFLDGRVSVGQVITYMALLHNLRMPMRFLLMVFSIVQQSVASARRVLALITTETELDENANGVAQPIVGDVVFDQVAFGYSAEPSTPEQPPGPGAAQDSNLVLKNISFHARPGETIAIVGQTGAGKTTLTRLVTRTFDTVAGQVRIDGIDVRAWSLDSLRSQIATIEQDIVLFSRTIAENIAFGARGRATQAQIEAAARLAQAHDFIVAFPDGYATVVGERGVTLSGGQRQRIAIARAFLADPRILIVDDSTSAIDSNTEDQIQRAMRRILNGRTTLLITHRLAQIMRADRILVLQHGELVAQGSHEELLATSPLYRQIFVPGERAQDAPRRSVRTSVAPAHE
ncbi:MAG: ABC transporter ATP-binding protein/permease [Chloroflexota bacterium]|nr:ABC transporter ATP-binding protein/permease [Chloroflexota bacterium]